MMILQWLDDDGINQGGLFILKENIDCFYYDHRVRSTFVVLRSGKEFRLAQQMAEVLEDFRNTEGK